MPAPKKLIGVLENYAENIGDLITFANAPGDDFDHIEVCRRLDQLIDTGSCDAFIVRDSVDAPQVGHLRRSAIDDLYVVLESRTGHLGHCLWCQRFFVAKDRRTRHCSKKCRYDRANASRSKEEHNASERRSRPIHRARKRREQRKKVKSYLDARLTASSRRTRK